MYLLGKKEEMEMMRLDIQHTHYYRRNISSHFPLLDNLRLFYILLKSKLRYSDLALAQWRFVRVLVAFCSEESGARCAFGHSPHWLSSVQQPDDPSADLHFLPISLSHLCRSGHSTHALFSSQHFLPLSPLGQSSSCLHSITNEITLFRLIFSAMQVC